MLEVVPSKDVTCAPYRYQNSGDNLGTITDLGLSEENIEGILRFLDDHGQRDDLDSYLNRPFEIKLQFEHKSRFSDGTFPVYYSALELETAQAEIAYQHQRRVLGRTVPRTVYYREVNCDFRGTVKDLQDYIQQFPFLIVDAQQGGYDQSNEVAKEAINQGLDGLLTRSARRHNGTCLPVFRRSALSNSRPGRHVAFSYDPMTDLVTVSDSAA